MLDPLKLLGHSREQRSSEAWREGGGGGRDGGGREEGEGGREGKGEKEGGREGGGKGGRERGREGINFSCGYTCISSNAVPAFCTLGQLVPIKQGLPPLTT